MLIDKKISLLLSDIPLTEITQTEMISEVQGVNVAREGWPVGSSKK